MILLAYLLGLALLSLLLRKWRPRPRSILIVGYNYLFVIPLFYAAKLANDASITDAAARFNLLLQCMYQAPKALAFGADLAVIRDPQISILCYIASLYTVRAVLLNFFQQALASVTMRLRMLWSQEIYVVSGEVEDARAMIREILKHRPRAAINFMPLRESDAGATLNAFVETRKWEDFLRPGRKYHILLLPEDRNQNLRHLDELNRLGERIANLRVTAFLDNDILRYEDLRYPKLDVYLVSREQLLVRDFLRKYPPLKRLMDRGEGSKQEGIFRPVRPFSLAVLGFGSLSREFLLTTWENAAFETEAPDGDGLNAIAVDSGLLEMCAPFFLDVPQMRAEENFAWLDAAPDSEACFQAIRARLRQLDQILIATEDTRRNLNIATRLLHLFRHSGMEQDHPQLVVALYESADGSVEFLSKEAGGIFLECNRSQFTFDELVERQTDRQAEELHRRYSETSPFQSKWNELDTYLQNSNRAVIWDIPNKLMLAGDLSAATRKEREDIYWKLAEYEHRRWNVFQYTHGWLRLPEGELTPEEVRAGITKRVSQKRHACLVPWDELDDLPQASPGLLKRYDYENVVSLFEGKAEGKE